MSNNHQPSEPDNDSKGRPLVAGVGLTALASGIAVGISAEVGAGYGGPYIPENKDNNGCPVNTKLHSYIDKDSSGEPSDGDHVVCIDIPPPSTSTTLPPPPPTSQKPPKPAPTSTTPPLPPTTTSTTLPPNSTEKAPESVAVGEPPVPTESVSTESSVSDSSASSSTEAIAEIPEKRGGGLDGMEDILIPIGTVALLGAIVLFATRRGNRDDEKVPKKEKARRLKHA